MKRAFTIIELLVVMTVIAILMTLVFSSVKGALAEARARRADALCQTVQSGLAAYHAQYDEWPEPLGSWVKNDSIPDRPNRESEDGQHDPSKLVLEAAEVRQMVRALVDEAKKGNPLMDISGLWVSRSNGEPANTGSAMGGGANRGAAQRGYGMSFMDAVRGTKWSKKKMKTAEMYFGYPETNSGYFRRFKMVYSISADQLTVRKQ